MANFLTAGELKSHIYEEIANEITRNDDSIIDDAINIAVDEMKGYLTKYNVAACIDTVLPANRHAKLLAICKDLACWYLITLCNVNIDYDKRMDIYDRAIEWLKGVQQGKIVPALPLAIVPNSSPATPVTPIKWQSNPKRNNHI
jgi:phage gp36-like protein